jgi:hypothetical protein
MATIEQFQELLRINADYMQQMQHQQMQTMMNFFTTPAMTGKGGGKVIKRTEVVTWTDANSGRSGSSTARKRSGGNGRRSSRGSSRRSTRGYSRCSSGVRNGRTRYPLTTRRRSLGVWTSKATPPRSTTS